MNHASPTRPARDGRVWIAILIGALLAVALAVGLNAPTSSRLLKGARQVAAGGAERLFRPIRPQIPHRQVDEQTKPAAAQD